jgi:hypothetical protein
MYAAWRPHVWQVSVIRSDCKIAVTRPPRLRGTR